MTDNNDPQMGELHEIPENTSEMQSAGSEPEVKTYEVSDLYRPHMWEGVKQIYICNVCERSHNEERRMIKHVAGHVPELDEEGKDG